MRIHPDHYAAIDQPFSWMQGTVAGMPYFRNLLAARLF
jgi:hypothetical protein